jgi:carbon storage regulator CsrA
MLVLSRRVDETIAVPEAGITVQVLRIDSNRVKIGIQAPDELGVLRGELSPEDAQGLKTRRVQRIVSREELHDLKNQLNAVRLTLHVVRRQRDAGNHDAAESALNRLFGQFELIQGTVSDRNSDSDRLALLVEDDSNERELLAGLLRMSGLRVHTAGDGVEALEYLQTHSAPDVVLLDMRMPRCDGRTTIERIRRNPRTAKLCVFAVSATEPAELGVATGLDGVDGWFAKPLNPELLTRQIGRILQTAASA